MRIGLLSDTHYHIDKSWAKYFESCDEIWHAGDLGNIEVYDYLCTLKPVRAVYGNIDGAIVRRTLKPYLYFELEGVTVLMLHIGGYPGRYDKSALKLIQDLSPQLFICGHSHILKVMYDPKYKMLTMNPGAAGIQGQHLMKTLIRFTLKQGRITDAEVIELGLKNA